MARVLLIRPLCASDEQEFAEPLGIERLASYLRAHGIGDVRIFDRRLYAKRRQLAAMATGLPTFWQDVDAAYGQDPPTHVGISLMTSADLPDTLRILSRVAARFPHAAVCAGGVFVTTNTREARRLLPQHVLLVLGEGEAPMLAWAQSDSEHPASTPAHAPISPNDWVPAYRPDLASYAALGCAVNLQTSRGCPGSCAFCATPRLPEPYRRWQPRDLDLVADEIEYEATRLAAVAHLPIFNVVDDDFGPLSRVEALAESLQERKLVVSFALEMRMASLVGQPRLAQRLSRLRKAGLTRVFVGVESIDERTLRSWNKPYDVSRLPSVVDAFGHAGIALQAGYILWHAHQSVASAKDEVERLWRLGIYTHRMALSRLIAFSGTGLSPQAACLSTSAQTFYDTFATRSADLTEAWMAAAIEEPHAAAVAHLTGDDARLIELQQTLEDINHRSYLLWHKLA